MYSFGKISIFCHSECQLLVVSGFYISCIVLVIKTEEVSPFSHQNICRMVLSQYSYTQVGFFVVVVVSFSFTF